MRSMMRLVGVFLLIGACSDPAATVAPSPTGAVPTVAVTRPPTTPSVAPSATAEPTAEAVQRLPIAFGPPRALEAGTYLTREGFEPVVSITVPEGWYGSAGSSGFGLGQGLDLVNEAFADAGLYVGLIGLEYDASVAAFGELEGVEFTEPSSTTTIDGHAATVFHAKPIADQVVLDEIAPGADLNFASDRQILIDVDGQTLLIRTELLQAAAEPVLNSVIESIRFP